MASYWVPLAVFGLFTTVEGYVPSPWYPWVYVAKVCAVIVSLVLLPRSLRDIAPSTRTLAPAILVGLVVFAEWILLDRWIPYPHIGTRTAFNPFSELADPLQLWMLLVTRFFGLVVLVPIIEESFWRNFALRWVTNPDLDAVPVGTYSQTAFWMVAVGFASTHPEWLVALVAGVLFALLLRSTRSMFAVVVSHAVANLALGVYIVVTGDWRYW
jgi:hypothetical protein